MKKTNKLKIAIQSKGRLADSSIEFLNSLGINANLTGRWLIKTCPNSGIEILYLRNEDIPEYVSRGTADFGIVWKNILIEKNLNTITIKNLGLCKCSLAIAVPINSAIKSAKDLDCERIATSYPNTLKNFLKENSINASIIPIKWSVEITTELNLSDAICDIVQTWKSLKENNLKQLLTILESEAVLVESPIKSKEKEQLLKLLK